MAMRVSLLTTLPTSEESESMRQGFAIDAFSALRA